MCIRDSYYSHFARERNTRFFPNHALYMADERQHVRRRRAASVDHEARVLFRHLRAADRITLQTALFDERACKMARRPLEGAAAARIFERLLLAPGTHISVHLRPDAFRRSGREAEIRRKQRQAAVHQRTASIAERQLGSGQDEHLRCV